MRSHRIAIHWSREKRRSKLSASLTRSSKSDLRQGLFRHNLRERRVDSADNACGSERNFYLPVQILRESPLDQARAEALTPGWHNWRPTIFNPSQEQTRWIYAVG